MASSIRKLLAPVERFLAIEAASGIVLISAAIVALAWANSPWSVMYHDIWQFRINPGIPGFSFRQDLHFWINEGLMTIFFFVVGLEIRREMRAGELSSIRRAALPLAAAIGGMLMPALIFLTLNSGRSSAAGWSIPMATDIAFAVGALSLLGSRVAPALRVLLLALAVVDDVGAILVIALFYSGQIFVSGLALLGVGIVMLLVLQALHPRSAWIYLPPAIIVWAGAYSAGVHPTLAGVILGLLAPLESLQHRLHKLVAFGIMPLFAFANAGVGIGEISLTGDSLWVFLGITLGLTFGKPLGILAFSWLATYLDAAALPRGAKWSHVGVVGLAGGIGFTMALFMAQLALPAGPLLETAKLAILTASILAGTLTLIVGSRVFKSSR